MAEIIDEVLENELEASTLDEEKIEDSEPEQPESEPEAKEETKPEDDLPEKYKGKSVKDIVAMHQEAEKLIGKQGSEVGDLRKIVDDFIKTQTATTSKTTENETELTSDDFYTDPDKAVKRAIDNHPSIKEAKEASLSMKRNETLSRINSEFPNVQEIVQDPAFAEWINLLKFVQNYLLKLKLSLIMTLLKSYYLIGQTAKPLVRKLPRPLKWIESNS